MSIMKSVIPGEIHSFVLRSYIIGSERKNLSDLWQNVGHDCGQEVDANDAVDRYSDHSGDNSSCRSSCFLFQVLDVLSIHDTEPKERPKEMSSMHVLKQARMKASNLVVMKWRINNK
jgi:hypothetical protein